MTRTTLALLAATTLLLAGCTYRGGIGAAGAYAPGATQDGVVAGLAPQQRVLYRDRELMIVEQPAGGTAELRFDDGRLQTWSAGR